MSLTLDLPADLERRLSSEASRLGIPIERYALLLLGDSPTTPSRPKNGAELVDFWRREGVIGSRSEIENSQARAREIRRRAESRPAG